MPRILSQREWFESLSSRSVFEADYESTIRSNADVLFPGFGCYSFSPLVVSEFGNAKPDLCLIDVNYRCWFVIEVELDHHSLDRHVEPQVRRLAYGRYTDEHAMALVQENPHLSEVRLKQLFASHQPAVIVLTPRSRGAWISPLSNLGARVITVEVFQDHRNRRVFFVDGEFPRVNSGTLVSRLLPAPFLSRSLRIESPAALDVECGKLDILIDGGITEWKLLRNQKEAYLLACGRFPLNLEANSVAHLHRNQDGTFYLEVQ